MDHATTHENSHKRVDRQIYGEVSQPRTVQTTGDGLARPRRRFAADICSVGMERESSTRYADVADLLETPVTLLLLHNYDVHCEMKNPCSIRVKATTAIATIQTSGDHDNRVREDLRRISGCETVHWETISSEDILNRNRDKLEVVQLPWKPTALQSRLETRCTTNNLRMLVDIHPALVFDKKLNAGWQEVADGNGSHM